MLLGEKHNTCNALYAWLVINDKWLLLVYYCWVWKFIRGNICQRENYIHVVEKLWITDPQFHHFLALLKSGLRSENAFFSGVKSCYDNGLKTKILCFIYLAELNVVQKGKCLTAFSKRTFKGHILSSTVKIFYYLHKIYSLPLISQSIWDHWQY